MSTFGDPEGWKGDDSPYEQLKVVREDEHTSNLLTTTHVFAGELVKVEIKNDFVRWGKLLSDHFTRLYYLYRFLTSITADVNQIPDGMGLDVEDLRSLRIPTASMDRDYLDRFEDHIASLSQAARSTSRNESAPLQAQDITNVVPLSFGFSLPPMAQAQPPAATVRAKARDYNTGNNLNNFAGNTGNNLNGFTGNNTLTLALHLQLARNTASPRPTARPSARAKASNS
jgi:hypothetical protein